MTKPSVLFVCTGNAARSVMAEAMLRARTDRVAVGSAGTHSIPGLPMSTRTRTALADFGVSAPDHRSRQVDDRMVGEADVVVLFEPMHLIYMQRHHDDAAARTASLPRLARDLERGPVGTLEDRLLVLDLSGHAFEPWEEVVDPAGGELPEFQAAARSIDELLGGFCHNLGI